AFPGRRDATGARGGRGSDDSRPWCPSPLSTSVPPPPGRGASPGAGTGRGRRRRSHEAAPPTRRSGAVPLSAAPTATSRGESSPQHEKPSQEACAPHLLTLYDGYAAIIYDIANDITQPSPDPAE